MRRTITIKRIKSISKDILEDRSWIQDSHDQREWIGMHNALDSLITHLEETEQCQSL